ncbi:MAG: radical SAM protein [Clostridiales Family XIII bacterium]|jgi:histone acetyltransferase (RNA polymerase elongator complex component)|nr:radical SAM protein [Clostridiales Family XIII bacterium]
MKTHAIIPIFIPHIGCPHDCVFCNQRKITARLSAPTTAEIEQLIERNLSTIEPRGIRDVEVAYFGGSFTGLPIEEQNELLKPAIRYRSQGRIKHIRLSTRPDYIDDEIVSNLLAQGVDIVELGVQSFDDEVLAVSNRGHDAKSSETAFALLKTAGIEVGLQLMAGLPCSTPERDIASARRVSELRPDSTRIYPTVILKDTTLHDMHQDGTYVPPTQDEMVETVKQMYLILEDAGITILRVGLKSTDIITSNGDAVSGSYHPAFRQLIESSIARDKIEAEIASKMKVLGEGTSSLGELTIYANPKNISCAAGHKGSNRDYFAKKYPNLSLKFISNSSIPEGTYEVLI